MLRQGTNEVVKVVLLDSMAAPVTALVAADFLASSVYLYKRDNTKVTIALTLGVNLIEVDATGAPGLYSVAIPLANLDQLGSLCVSFQPAAAAFVSTYVNDAVYVDQATNITNAVTSIKGAQAIDNSQLAGGALFSAADSLYAIRTGVSGLGTSIAGTVFEELLASHLTPNTFGELFNILDGILLQRMKINKVSKQLELYRADNVTIWKSWPLSDLNGAPATLNSSERGKAI